MSVSLLHSLHCHTCWYLGLSALEFGNAGKVAMLFLDQNYEAVSLQTNAAMLHNCAQTTLGLSFCACVCACLLSKFSPIRTLIAHSFVRGLKLKLQFSLNFEILNVGAVR